MIKWNRFDIDCKMNELFSPAASASQVSGFLPEKNLEGAKDNRPLFFKTVAYYFCCSFYCFLNFRGAKVVLGGAPRSRKPRFGKKKKSQGKVREI